jgi:Uma2 family endonuclease
MEATQTLVPVEEYLRSSYEPDCDYVDGQIVERNLGEKDHSKLQTKLAVWFGNRGKELGVEVFVEQRVQISARRFRIPDVCVIAGEEPADQIFRDPPHICIEVLSPDDSLVRMQDKIDDYLAFGVPNVWVINPANHRA